MCLLRSFVERLAASRVLPISCLDLVCFGFFVIVENFVVICGVDMLYKLVFLDVLVLGVNYWMNN